MAEILRVFFALVLVIGALWVAARLARRPLRNRRAGGLDVLARTQLSRGAAVTVVQVDKTALVLGVTDQQVSLLHVADAEAFAAPEPVARTVTPKITQRAAKTDAGDTATAAAAKTDKQAALTGSALSPSTWKQALDALRERSVRK
ncbi:FliO/MopB family protein [Actinokineospora inagensis]|uniref:FliO/MopB family protein n=1 Tax=Actinokineospora inagensis TaxID=103730 RepID=UPI00041AC02A|nr:flagellar biosynthetic protein FliO [Actinokineospora inagensis]